MKPLFNRKATIRNWLFLLIVFILSIFEVTILNYFKIFGVKPNLLLITVIIASLFFEFKWVIFFGIFAGILKDIFSVNTFGINTLLFPLWSYLAMELSKSISLDNNFVRVFFIFVMGILNNIIMKLIFVFLGNHIIPLSVFPRIAILESLYTAFISPLVFLVFKVVR